MFKTVSRICRAGCLLQPFKTRLQGRRLFLSEAFRCQEAWEKRLDAPVLQQVKLDDFHYEVDSKYQAKQKISAIDVDLFANAVRDADHLDELEDLVHKLRLSPSTGDMLPSTPHALVRLFLDAGRGDDLLRILGDRINYGVFPDHYTYCLLMDAFLRQENYTAAAQVGVLQMLQEDWGEPLTTHLSLYSCHMHLQRPGQWQPEEEPPPPDDGEEVKVRVKYLRNPYFDDHFDLRDPKLLVGKTAAWAARRVEGAAGRTYQPLGWALYEKWGRSLDTLERLASAPADQPVFYKEGLERLQALVDEATQKEGADVQTLERLSLRAREAAAGSAEGLGEALETAARRVASEAEPRMVSEQRRVYEEWARLREERLKEELGTLRREHRREEMARAREELERQERTIFFFDHEEQWELRVEQQEQLATQVAKVAAISGKASEDEEYVPPEVRPRRA